MTHYDANGNPVEDVSIIASGPPKHDINEVLDHGREPDFQKETLIGKDIVVYGIMGPEDWSLGPVYFVLLKRKEDAEIDDPWGVMFPASSPVVQATLRAARQNMMPFRAVLQKTPSASNPRYEYWEFRRK